MEKIYTCSFCGLPDEECKYMVAGNGDACICGDCVVACLEILIEHKAGEGVHLVVRKQG